MADTRSEATVNTAMDAVIERLEAIGAGSDYEWLTAPVTVRRAGNPVEDLAAARPALFVRTTLLSEATLGVGGKNDCKWAFSVACLGSGGIDAERDIWDLESDVRRALLTGTTLDGTAKGGLTWQQYEAETLGGPGGTNESIAVATFTATILWETDSP